MSQKNGIWQASGLDFGGPGPRFWRLRVSILEVPGLNRDPAKWFFRCCQKTTFALQSFPCKLHMHDSSPTLMPKIEPCTCKPLMHGSPQTFMLRIGEVAVPPPPGSFNGISSLDVRSMCLILVWKLLGVAWGLMQKQPKVENVDDMLPIHMPRAAGLRVASAGSAKRKQFGPHFGGFLDPQM